MATSSLWPFNSPEAHEAISGIIRRRSTNSVDVREAALQGVDLSFARSILDLGCGFGFMAETLAKRAAPNARVVGVDVWQSNEKPFLDKVASTGRLPLFRRMQVNSELPWEAQSFDLVVCSYSLYFFTDVVPEVARILTPHGLFLALTHTEQSFIDPLRAAGLAVSQSSLHSLASSFSAENGQRILERWFGEVSRTDYRNSLRFEMDHVDELLAYLKFKLPFLISGSRPGADLPEELAKHARGSVSQDGGVTVEKSDTAFWCRSPICRPK